MGLVLRYARLTKAGTWQYRRRIPTVIRDIIHQGEFKRYLGATRPEAMRAYPKIDAEFVRLVSDTVRHHSMRSVEPSTQLEVHKAAERRAKELAEWPVMIGGQTIPATDPDASRLLRDSFLSGFKEDDEGDPVGVPKVERRAYDILVSGGRVPRPSATVEDAKRLYFEEKIKGDINEKAKKSRLDRVISHLNHSVENGRALDKMTRENARDVRDHMLRDLNMNPATAQRYMNDIRAVLKFGITELGPQNAYNPFLNLSIKKATVAREERSPIPEKTLRLLSTRMYAHAGTDLRQIWEIIEGTGCRLGEVSGLLVSDIRLDGPIPYIDVVNHPHRRLKTKSSVRRIPLVGKALEAAAEAVEMAGEGRLVFHRYGKVRGADTASASLMKHIRTVTDDPKIVVHSLRHTMEDRLIRARIPVYDRNMIMGHRNPGEGDRYGGADARLEVALPAVKAALGLD
ncbi:site-specific integrase [Rhizobium rhizogenes]|uniref:site-specific integrase n=1 Tax=Rhizobium rhizogenes TaxID=359 RepID=UPI0022BF4F34|nr:site-specific integrase [Rhizobium rhizogenes]MCZ7453501.1 site-specific integrase [Rhizobium rhizogenes]